MKMKRLFIMATLAVASMAGISVMAQAPAKEGACKTECVKSKGCCQADKECPAKADCPKAKCAQGDAKCMKACPADCACKKDGKACTCANCPKKESCNKNCASMKADCPKAKGLCANTGKHGCQGNKPCPKK